MKPTRFPILLVFLPLLVTSLFFSACNNVPRTPQAKMFSTLQAAAAGIDSFRTDYEAAYRAGDLDQAGLEKLDKAFNTANEAIITAARALDAGMLATTPGNVEAAAQELLKLVLQLVPPKYRANSSKWKV